MNGFRPGMADAAVISNNGIRHVRASDITRYGKMRFCFWNGPGRFRHFLTIQGDRLEIHIKRRGVIHHQLVTFATPFKGRCEQVPDMRSCLSSGAMEQGSS